MLPATALLSFGAEEIAEAIEHAPLLLRILKEDEQEADRKINIEVERAADTPFSLWLCLKKENRKWKLKGVVFNRYVVQS